MSCPIRFGFEGLITTNFQGNGYEIGVDILFKHRCGVSCAHVVLLEIYIMAHVLICCDDWFDRRRRMTRALSLSKDCLAIDQEIDEINVVSGEIILVDRHSALLGDLKSHRRTRSHSRRVHYVTIL